MSHKLRESLEETVNSLDRGLHVTATKLRGLVRESHRFISCYVEKTNGPINPTELAAHIEKIAEEYEWGGDENVTITDRDRMLLIDFAHGIMADEMFMVMVRANHDLIRNSTTTQHPAADAQPVAWATHHDTPMLFPSRDEAISYCDQGENPVPLYAHPPPSAPGWVPAGVVQEYLDARACYETATRPPNSHAPAPPLRHDNQAALRLRDARSALNAAAYLAQYPPQPVGVDAEAQPVAWAPCNRDCDCVGDCKVGIERPVLPPSATVGVQGLAAKWRQFANFCEHRRDAEPYLIAADELDSALAKQPAAEVCVDFPQIGVAGPFPVIDGKVTLPGAAMKDLIRHARTGFSADVGESLRKELIGAGRSIRKAERAINRARSVLSAEQQGGES